MTLLEEVLEANEEFLESGEKTPVLSKYPQRKLVVVTCMDTRLVDFNDDALGIERGDAQIIKNAGNSVIDNFGETIRSLVVCIFGLGVEEIMIIGHHNCGVANTTSDGLIEAMISRGISEDAIKLVEEDLVSWIDGYKNPLQNVLDVVKKIKNNPLIPKDIPIHGLIINPDSGKLSVLIDGYKALEGK